MKIGVTKLTPENIAPSNVKCISVFDGSNKVCDVDITKMRAPNIGTKLYSFGLVSDLHLNITDGYDNSTSFDNALTFFETQGASFCCHTGDMTNIGFWYYESDTDIYLHQFGEYKRICELHPNLPVYGCCGNHESYNKSISENLLELQEYTGHGLAYTMTYGNDLFIFIGQSEETIPMSEEHFLWLGNTLGANKDLRCFVFIHPYVDASDCGNPLGLHKTPLFNSATISRHGYDKSTFVSLMSSYPNTILFHGHSHMMLENQESVKNANYSTALGFKSVHIPSTAYCRDIRSGAMEEVNMAQGYLVDVHPNHIVLKGYDFQANDFVPIAQYCIDTTLQSIEADTFTDSTGIITT